MDIKRKLGDKYWNLRSSRFAKKLIVIESDDWGSLRTESIEQRDELNEISSRIKNDPYTQLDGLANADDLSALFHVLKGVKDSQGKPAVLTANVCMANPDFVKIKENRFEQFYYERFDHTILKKSDGRNVLDLWKVGENDKVFQPQLHGREHLHAMNWLLELKNGNKDLLKAFNLNTWGIPCRATRKQRRKNLQAALDVYNLDGELAFQEKWVSDSAEMFDTYFGYRSRSFIAPAYTWHSLVHKDFESAGIKSIQGIKMQYQPKPQGYKQKLRFMGEHIQKHDLYLFPRNVFFEPSLNPNIDWYSQCIKGIGEAFKRNQPAIIGSHRINFIGKLDEKNRTNNLRVLRNILHKALDLYPEVIFTTSDKLINYLK